MDHQATTSCLARRFLLTLSLLAGAAFASFPVALVDAAPPKPAKKPPAPAGKPADKPTPPPAPRSSILTNEAWAKAPLTPAKPEEIDQLVTKELEATKISPAPVTSDEQFLRRVTLDLTGQLPQPADVEEFVADKDPKKREKMIDKLLDSDEYAQHWARYWREVIESRLSDFRDRVLARAFEAWIAEELKNNKSWDRITREMIAAEGECKYDDNGKNGNVFFLASHHGNDAANERAAETSRISLGIQIQCAQCHDHPSDQWKRVQFHELAAYFARLRERPMRDMNRIVGTELTSLPRAEHEMPSKEDPKKSFTTYPRFLDGKAPSKDLGDKERRKALADSITDKGNYWFAGAFANRVWGELMGQSFYQPVDDMGPQKEAVFADVLVRLASSFRATDYDIKRFFRTVCNSQTYQRQIRLGESSEQHLHFAAAYPKRLPADALWESLANVLGHLSNGPAPAGPYAGLRRGPQGLEGLFKAEFDFDPSLKADEIEGSISQALLLMNNPALNQRMQARGTTLLGRLLSSYKEDDEALRMVYLKTLARKPTDKERDKCRDYIAKVGNRAEAFEDILWALINSTEFQTKR
ncbi:MAG TPA: DUF1549 domain-containing protein [Gemmataceae bacterium]